MEPITAGIGAAIDIAGWVNGLIQSGQNRDAAMKAISEATGIKVPDLQQLMLHQAEQQGAVQNINPGETRQAQLGALSQIQDMAAKGGMDEGSIAALQQAEGRVGQDVRGQNAAIQNQGLRTGTWGGGQQLAQQMGAVQGGANRLAMAGTQAAADARLRALDAIKESGRLSGDIRSQDERLAESNRAEQIARDRFNTQLRQSTNQFNAQAPISQAQLAIGRSGAINNATAILNGQQQAAQNNIVNGQQVGRDIEGFGSAASKYGKGG